MTGADRKTIRKRLKPFIARTEKVRRPRSVLPIKNREKQFSYLLKAYWPRKFRKRDGNGRIRTTDYRLKGPERRELLSFLADYTVDQLIFLMNARRGANGAIRLRERTRDVR